MLKRIILNFTGTMASPLDIKDEHPYLESHYINHYLGPATYQKFLQKPQRHSVSEDETLANVHLLSKPQLILL